MTHPAAIFNSLLGSACMFLVITGAFAHHDSVYFQGVNYLQTASVSLNSFTSMQSLRKIKDNGADTVALIAFMQQDKPASSRIQPSNAVNDRQLTQAIADAQDIGLRVVLKPQILVPGSWAGEVNPGTDAGWQQWFDNYQQLLVHYAQIAQRYEVEMLVLGTELRHAAIRPRFRELITRVRNVYHGEISYAAHGLAGFQQFPYWNLLDSASLTLYPPLGNDWSVEHVKEVMSSTITELEALTAKIEKPFWIAEIGISSRQGSFRHPWLVADRLQGEPDEELQAKVLALWLKNLQQPWIHGVLIWSWFSDVDQGGSTDTGFTIQNKSAERVVRCYWKNKC